MSTDNEIELLVSTTSVHAEINDQGKYFANALKHVRLCFSSSDLFIIQKLIMVVSKTSLIKI